jgi:hypothetical protein
VLRAKLLGKGRKARLGDAPDFAELHGPEELLS